MKRNELGETKTSVNKMSKNELKGFVREIMTRINLGIGVSDNLAKLGIYAVERYDRIYG